MIKNYTKYILALWYKHSPALLQVAVASTFTGRSALVDSVEKNGNEPEAATGDSGHGLADLLETLADSLGNREQELEDLCNNGKLDSDDVADNANNKADGTVQELGEAVENGDDQGNGHAEPVDGEDRRNEVSDQSEAGLDLSLDGVVDLALASLFGRNKTDDLVGSINNILNVSLELLDERLQVTATDITADITSTLSEGKTSVIEAGLGSGVDSSEQESSDESEERLELHCK